jgi:hypothetical protein
VNDHFDSALPIALDVAISESRLDVFRQSCGSVEFRRSRKDFLLFPLFFFRVRVVTLLELSSRRGLFPVGVIERPSQNCSKLF